MITNLTGIILRTREWGEKDLLVTVLSSDGERMDLVAKGAAVPGSRRRGHLEGMNLIRGTIYHSAHHPYLQSPQAECSFSELKNNIDRILRVSVFLEILEKSMQEENHQPEVYDLLLETLQDLNQKDAHAFIPEVALIKLAHLLGFLPSFKQCGHCHRTLEEDAHWDHDAGTLACADCSNNHHPSFPLKYCKAFEFFRRAPSSECQKVTLLPEEHETLKEWIPGFFSPHLEKPLKTLRVQA